MQASYITARMHFRRPVGARYRIVFNILHNAASTQHHNMQCIILFNLYFDVEI